MIRLLAILIALLSTSATAQVYRCKLPSGQTSYSSQPCMESSTGVLVQEQRSQESLMRERENAREAEMRKMRQKMRALEQAQEQQQAVQRAQPISQLPQRLQETSSCKTAQSDLENAPRSVYRNNDEKRSAINAAIAKVNAACGSKTELMQEPAKIIVTPRSSTCIQTGRAINCN